MLLIYVGKYHRSYQSYVDSENSYPGGCYATSTSYASNYVLTMQFRFGYIAMKITNIWYHVYSIVLHVARIVTGNFDFMNARSGMGRGGVGVGRSHERTSMTFSCIRRDYHSSTHMCIKRRFLSVWSTDSLSLQILIPMLPELRIMPPSLKMNYITNPSCTVWSYYGMLCLRI